MVSIRKAHSYIHGTEDWIVKAHVYICRGTEVSIRKAHTYIPYKVGRNFLINKAHMYIVPRE